MPACYHDPATSACRSWYLIGYHEVVDAATTLRNARRRAGLTLRGLAARAGTSHASLAAYESGAKVPRVDTLERILRAAGFEPQVELLARPAGEDPVAKGEELVAVLELAGQFPARHTRSLRYPRFGPAT
jgi:transcriptional regulator with XRE-family HTH domain